MIPAALYIANDHAIELRELTNGATGERVEAATVLCTLYDAEGVEIAGQAWPLVLAHIGQGDYRGTLDSTLALTERQRVRAEISASAGGLDAHWTLRLTAIPRT